MRTPGHPPPPWERQPGETQRSWAAFCAFRDAGPTRTLISVAKATKGSAGVFGQWSAKHLWVSRSAAWDSECDRRLREAAQKAREDMVARHARTAQQHLLALGLPLQELSRRIQAGRANMTDSTVRELIELVQRSAHALRALVDVERASHGMRPVSQPGDADASSGDGGGDVRVEIVRAEVATGPQLPVVDGQNGHGGNGAP